MHARIKVLAHFFDVHSTSMTWKFQMGCFLENLNTKTNFSFTYMKWDVVLKKSGKFAQKWTNRARVIGCKTTLFHFFSGTLSLSSLSWLFCCSVLVWTARRKRVTIWYAFATLNKLRRGHSKFVWLRSSVLLGKHRTNIEKGKTFSWRRDHP